MIEGEMILEFQEIVKDYRALRARIEAFEAAQPKVEFCGFHDYVQLTKGISSIAEVKEVRHVGNGIHIEGVEPHSGISIVQVEEIR